MALLDSVILIDYLNGIQQARATVDAALNPVISVVTLAEVMTGVDAAGHSSTLAFLKTFPILPIDTTVAEEAAKLRQAHHWKLPDAFQAALALSQETALITRNTKDFKPGVHPFVIVPYTL